MKEEDFNDAKIKKMSTQERQNKMKKLGESVLKYFLEY